MLSAAFVGFSGAVALGWLGKLDWAVRSGYQEYFPGFVDMVLSLFSRLGSPIVAGAILLVLLVRLLMEGRHALAARLLAVFVGTGLLEVAMKLYLPQVTLPPKEVANTEYFTSVETVNIEETITGMHSYPSGHVLRGVIVLGALYLLSKGRFRRAVVVAALSAMAVARVYFEAHWASDVVGAALLGATALLWAFGAKERLKPTVIGSKSEAEGPKEVCSAVEP